MSNLFANVGSHTPVTALAIHDGLILSGQGPFLRIYDPEHASSIQSRQIFKKQSIHGIAIANLAQTSPVLLIWGGRRLALVRLLIDHNHIENSPRSISINVDNVIKTPDWILYVCFGSRTVSSSSHAAKAGTPAAVFITAHNVLYGVSLKESTLSLSVERLTPGPRCILYSAHVKWISPTEILVASGTVFGEIVIWSCLLGHAISSSRTATVLTGHEGSIFGVQISDIIERKTGHALRILTSCSDDRTIRVWDITDLRNISEPKIPSDGIAAEYLSHETGFLSYQTNKTETSSASRCCAVAMGHVSRIWSIRYIYNLKPDHIPEDVVTILSTGEDATCQTWKLVQDLSSSRSPGFGKATFDLIHDNTFSHHTGKNLWSVAVNQGPLNNERPLIATGGADGRVVSCTLPSLTNFERKLSDQWAEWDISEVLQPILELIGHDLPTGLTSNPHRSKKPSKAMPDCFRGYAFIGNDSLLLTTNNGLVLLARLRNLEFKKTTSWSWHYIALLHELRSYSVVCGIPELGIALIGSAKGTIHCFDASKKEINLLAIVEGKVADIFVQPLEPSIGVASLLITQMGTHPLKHIYLRREDTGSLTVFKEEQITGPALPQSTTVTSYVAANMFSLNDLVFLGCRNGKIVIRSNGASRKHTFSTICHGQGNEAVTKMYWCVNKEQFPVQKVLGWLFSVGRDGKCTIHCVNKSPDRSRKVHELVLPFGPNIEGIYVNPSTFDVFIYGFHSKHFIVHNLSVSQDVMAVECGGAHRIWTFSPRFDQSRNIIGGKLAWTKASKLNLYEVKEQSHRIIETGGHGREIKTCAVASTVLTGSSVGPLIATGAEDTDIRLSCYSEALRRVSGLSILRKHVTGVQSLQWSEDGRYLFSCGGFEEFLIWRVEAAPGVRVGVVCESACPIENTKSELRITGFAVKEVKEGEHGNYQNQDRIVLVISMVYSNSMVKVFRYSSIQGEMKWETCAAGRYTSACLTRVAMLYFGKGNLPVLLCGATDGHITAWTSSCTELSSVDTTQNTIATTLNPSDELVCIGIQPVHQSSIKSLSTSQLTKTTHIAVTSGDDNAMGITIIRFHDDQNEPPNMASLIVPRTHAAATTAAQILLVRCLDENDQRFELRVATASNDQRIKLWEIQVDLTSPGIDGVDVRRIASHYTPVADISSMALFPVGQQDEEQECVMKILVCGVGMEVWTVDTGRV